MEFSRLVYLILCCLRSLKVRIVRHRTFVGLRGEGVRRVPPVLWNAIDFCHPEWMEILPSEPGPFQARRQRGAQ
jgi:hypothetical protein